MSAICQRSRNTRSSWFSKAMRFQYSLSEEQGRGSTSVGFALSDTTPIPTIFTRGNLAEPTPLLFSISREATTSLPKKFLTIHPSRLRQPQRAGAALYIT